MDFEQFEEEKPKIPTNLLVFVIVSALVIAFSIYYISKSGKQRPLTTEELVEGDTLSTESTDNSESLASSENEPEEELGSEETEILKNVKANRSNEVISDKPEEKSTQKSKVTPTKTVNLEKKTSEKKKTEKVSPKTTKTENIQGIIHVHTVRKNEFLSTIASMYNYPIKNIQQLNGIEEDLHVGQKIKVKVQAIHKVKKGELLVKIAQNYGVKVTDVCKINGIRKDAPLKEGQKLVIPLKPNKK